VARRTAPRLLRTSRSRRRLPETCMMIPVLFGLPACSALRLWPAVLPPEPVVDDHPTSDERIGPSGSSPTLRCACPQGGAGG
jgi:hypothetical protein